MHAYMHTTSRYDITSAEFADLGLVSECWVRSLCFFERRNGGGVSFVAVLSINPDAWRKKKARVREVFTRRQSCQNQSWLSS